MRSRTVLCCTLLAGCASVPPVAGRPVGQVASEPVDQVVLSVPIQVVLGTCKRPPYPERLRRRGIGGSIAVTFIVDTIGSVDRGSIQGLRGNELGPLAETFLSSCRFLPARAGEGPVRARGFISITATVVNGNVDIRSSSTKPGGAA